MRKISTIEVYCYYFLLVVLFGTLQEMTDFFSLMNSTKYRGLYRTEKMEAAIDEVNNEKKKTEETCLKM